MKYVVFLYFGSQLVRTVEVADFFAVSDACHAWWNADTGNLCAWEQKK